MIWQNYCNKYELLLSKNSDLTPIRLELFLALDSSKIKTIIKCLISIIKVFIYLFTSKKELVSKQVNNIYFVDSETSANLGTLNPLYKSDLGSKLLIINKKVENSKSFKNSKEQNINFEYYYKLYIKDISIIFILTKLISKDLDLSFFIIFPLVVRYITTKNSLDLIFKRIKSKNIFTSNDTLLTSNLAIQLAKKNKIIDYTLQHGFLTHFYLPTTATNYIVWGEEAKEWFENRNINTTILSLGTPRLDKVEDIKQNGENIKNDFYKKYNIDKSKKIFFYMSHSQAPEFGIEIHKENFEALKEVIKNESYQLIIKLHPSENRNLFDDVFKIEKKNIILLPKDENLYNTIISSYISASAYSTTLVESMCFEKPTLQMNMLKISSLPDYSKKNGCINIEDIEKLNIVLNQLNFQNEIIRQTKLVNETFTNLGNASNKILEFIGENYVEQN